jgi:acetyl esterase/lipase
MTQDLRAESSAPVVYLEIPGAQHAFDIFASPRSEHAKLGVMQFLCYCYAEHQRSKR